MARQAIDIVELEEIGALDYKFAVQGRQYRIHFEQGAWMLDEFVSGDYIEWREVGSLGEGINQALDDCGY